MRDMPNSERPRERLRDAGASYLNNAELLAILLRTGTPTENVLELSARLLSQFQGLEGLAKASHAELCAVYGFGEAKAAQLQAAIELGKRLAISRGAGRVTIGGPEDVAALLSPEMAFLDQEHFRVLVLNTKNEVMASPDVFIGSVNSTTVRTSEVFKEAVRLNCPNVITVHNHPSGDPTPSPEDVALTHVLVKAGKLLEIKVLDHVIIGRDRHVSLNEQRKGF
ncbi:MAG: DNA repair protein RadC [Dehalococcoidia bacterium]